MRVLIWVVRIALFCVLFVFALNNQHTGSVHWFFGWQWQAPMVFIVLAAFALGCILSSMALLPGIWRRWRTTKKQSILNDDLLIKKTKPDPVVLQSKSYVEAFEASHPAQHGI
jgi:lipopolysaccharide assembly protein A